MKVFISHSSKDKWIARKLSEEIIELGCTTFLDEKDIETGQSIDEEIRSHLHGSDDFLLLLTPESIKSHWVLIELGGALALEKKVIIILLYLGANDIPHPISKYLARDINDIEKYYTELQDRLAGKPVPKITKPTQEAVRSNSSTEFSVGEFVRLVSRKPSSVRSNIGWIEEDMEEYLGRKVEISLVDPEDRSVQIKQDGGEFWWAFEWLLKLDE
ncbi:MAG: toll/interleukin-1 receptor domain-containing protein [Aureispira sp.]